MKLNQILFFVILLLLVSCNVDNRKTNTQRELTKVILELKELGKFENADYEFIDKPNEHLANQNFIKVTFSNTDIKDLDEEGFGKTSAKKIFNLNEKTKDLEAIWFSITNGNLRRNLIYQSSDLKD